MKKKSIFLFGLFCVLLASAQEPLSLSDAIQLGLQRNYGILIEQKNIETAVNNNEWGAAGRLPTVQLNAASNNSISKNTGQNQFFQGVFYPELETKDIRNYSLQPGGSVNWTLFQGNKAIISKRRFEQLEAESYKNADVVVANTLQAIISAYYLAVLEQGRLDEFEKQLDLSSDKIRYIKTKQDLGGAVTSDVLLEENNFLTDSANYINQQLALNNAFRNLNVVLAEPELNKFYTLTDTLTLEQTVYNLEDLKGQALSGNVDIEKIYLTQSVLELTTRQQRADQFPTLSMNAGYNWNRSSLDLRSAELSAPGFVPPDETFINKSGTYFANFTLTFNLFDGKRINRAIRNALVQEDIGNLRVEQMEQSVSKDLLDA